MAASVFLITSFSKPWDNGWFYKAGLEQNGIQVTVFDPAGHPAGSEEVVRLVRDTRPDFILHTKDELPADVFDDLRRHAPVVMWYPDPVIPEWLPRYVRACDLFLTMTEGLVDAFREMNPRTFWLSQAFEASCFDVAAITEEDRRVFSADVGFVGNLGSKSQYLSRRDSLERVIRSGMRLKWWGPKIPWKPANIPLIYGRLGRAYGGLFVWGETYAKVARLSRVFLAFDSKPELAKSMSARMYTAVGCGAFYLCRHVTGIEDVLVPDREIVTFRTDDEMIDKIRYYLAHDDLRVRISAAGRERVLRDHTYRVRMRQLCDIVTAEGGRQ